MAIVEGPAAPVRLRWWFEIAFAATFYAVYSAVRNQFGSEAVNPASALRNADRVIDFQLALKLYHEETIQDWFEGSDWFFTFWNMWYGYPHFVVTLGVMVWLYRRHPVRYRRWRSALAATTGLALIGFATFPLMPPRLLGDCGPYGGCQEGHRFVDTLAEFGGTWSFDSGAVQDLSNQYAAMPSLHIGWAAWCLLAAYPVVLRRRSKAALVAYPFATLFAIVVTANHYWIDAIGGLIVLGAGCVVSGWVLERIDAWRSTRPPAPAFEPVESGLTPVPASAHAGLVEPSEG